MKLASLALPILVGALLYALSFGLPGTGPASTPTNPSIHSIEPPPVPPDKVPDPLPVGLVNRGGCVMPVDATEVTTEKALAEDQQVYEAAGQRYYVRKDAGCISLVVGKDAPPDVAPKGDENLAEALEGGSSREQ